MKNIKGLSLRGNVWWIDLWVNGKRVRKSLGLPKEQYLEAERYLLEYWRKIALKSIGVEEKNPLLKEIFESYLKKLEYEVGKAYYEQVLNHFYRFMYELGYKRVKDIIPSKVMDWLNKDPRRNTATQIQINVISALNYGKSIGLIDENPLKDLPKIKHRKKKREALTAEQYIEFGRHIFQYSCGSLLFFIMRTGCRFSEAATLQWKHVSLSEAKVVVFSENNKTKKTKEIPISSDLLFLLGILKTKDTSHENYVFVTRSGQQFSSRNVRRIVKIIAKKIGRPDFTTHALRNTFVTLSLNARANLLDVQQIVGHSEAMTTSRYDCGDINRKRQVVECLPPLMLPHEGFCRETTGTV